MILLLLFCAPMMMGFEELYLPTLDTDKPLVDLGGAIDMSENNTPGVPNPDMPESDVPSPIEPDQPTPDEPAKPKLDIPSQKKYKLTVMGRDFIFVDENNITLHLDTGRPIIDHPSIMYRINKYDEENAELTLDADYAELYAYLELVDILHENSIPFVEQSEIYEQAEN